MKTIKRKTIAVLWLAFDFLICFPLLCVLQVYDSVLDALLEARLELLEAIKGELRIFRKQWNGVAQETPLDCFKRSFTSKE